MVGAKTLLERLCIIIGALDERLASHIVLHLELGGVEDLVVGATGGGMDKTAGDACHKKSIVNLKLDGMLEGLAGRSEHLVELLSLSDCSWETIEDKTASGVSNVMQTGITGHLGSCVRTRSYTPGCSPIRS